MNGVLLQTWHRDLGDHLVGGSVYAVAPALRVQAARQLAAAHCRVHVDVILGPDGSQGGVSFDELTAIRAAAPNARIDVHLIALGWSPGSGGRAEARHAIECALRARAEHITVGRQHLSRHATELAAARAAGTAVWLEIPPAEPVLDAPPAGPDAPQAGIDGLLVMLIEPGTTQPADLAHLDKVRRLAPHLPVGVDGGVTRSIAITCQRLGARYIVSGRDLLTTRAAAAEPLREGSDAR